jgi:hypothetical protein
MGSASSYGWLGKTEVKDELGSTMIRAALCTVLASPAVQEQPWLALGAVAATAAGSLDYYIDILYEVSKLPGVP